MRAGAACQCAHAALLWSDWRHYAAWYAFDPVFARVLAVIIHSLGVCRASAVSARGMPVSASHKPSASWQTVIAS
jgi:hypothetical protein